ncbi:MAG: glycosyltransferase family 39 protein [Candidatus Aminicenantes bacterium]|nr:MAG: glycosyltransferase family 39 protein [Candidatus Aminicenantes bacterium]
MRRFLERFDIVLLLTLALLFKIILIILFEYKLYPDVIRTVMVGQEYIVDKNMMSITSKTYVGPVVWYSVVRFFGIWGLKIVNLVAFVFLFIIQYMMGKKSYKRDSLLIALFLFSFYVGTNLNLVAGEQDDFFSPLFFCLGVLIYLYRGNAFLSAFLMGLGFLFKFSAGIFFVGFVLYLLIKKKWRQVVLSTAGMVIPFLTLNLIDGFYSLNNFFYAFQAQHGYSSWGAILFKFFSTGIVFAVVFSLWTLFHEKSNTNLLFFIIPSLYPVYALLNRVAYSASYVMMFGILFFSFLLAEFLLKNRYFGKGKKRTFLIFGALVFYLVITSLITLHNLSRDPENAYEAISLILSR